MPQPVPSGPKVLLADDSKIVRATARKLIGDDTNLLLAESGEEAWAAITSDPDILVVFCDVNMPGLDGYGLLERIRGDERETVNRLPVIMVTGQEEGGAREDALGRGATDFINKPFDRAELIARTRSWATQDGLRRRAAELEACQTQDTATGLGNARYFEKRLKTARAYTLRHDQALAVIHIDLTGAERGDGGVQRAAGQTLAHSLREEDVLTHLGKGRFAAVCPGCDRAGAHALGRRLMDALRSDGDGAGALAAAVGVYVPPRDSQLTVRTLYAEARKTIDAARRRGDGALVPGEEKTGNSGNAKPEKAPSLDEGLAILAQPDGARRLAPHMQTLLEQAARLFEAAPAEVAEPVLERLHRRPETVDG